MLRKFEFMLSSLNFVWNRLQTITDNFEKLSSNDDWKIVQDGLAKIIEVLIEVTGNSSTFLMESETPNLIQFHQLSNQLLQHRCLADEDASMNIDLKELLALEMSLYWRLINLCKQFK